MSYNKGIRKDKLRKYSYDIYTTQGAIWSKALDVTKQMQDKTKNSRYVFADNFQEYICSMLGEIKSVEKHHYKTNQYWPQKMVTPSLQKYFNRMHNVYEDKSLTDDDMYSFVRHELNEMFVYCFKMNKKYSKLYHFKN